MTEPFPASDLGSAQAFSFTIDPGYPIIVTQITVNVYDFAENSTQILLTIGKEPGANCVPE